MHFGFPAKLYRSGMRQRHLSGACFCYLIVSVCGLVQTHALRLLFLEHRLGVGRDHTLTRTCALAVVLQYV